MSDKCGDVYVAPLPDPAAAWKHLLGHTAMTITDMALLKEGTLLATGDRAECIRVSQVCCTRLWHLDSSLRDWLEGVAGKVIALQTLKWLSK